MSDDNDVLDVRGTVANAANLRSFDFPTFARTATTFNGEGGDDTLAIDLATSYNATYDGGTGTDLLIMDWSRSTVGIQRFGDGYRSYSHTETVNNQQVDRFFTVTYTNVERFDIETGKSTVLFGTNPFPFSNAFSNANDSVVGGAFDDRFKVWGGYDTVDGGGGSDTLVIDWSLWDHFNSEAVSTTITGSLATGYSGRIATDRPWFNNTVITFQDSVNFTGIERFDVTLRNFGQNNDSLTTGDGDDTARGMAGDDTIDSRGGIDVIDGGVGDADRWIADKSFMTAGQAMALDLDLNGVQGTYLGTGTVTGIESINLTTGAGNDIVFTRRAQLADTVMGGGGDDVIKVLGGRDSVDGGSGSDTLTVDWSSWNHFTSRAIGASVNGSLATGYSGNFNTDIAPDRVDFTGIERFDLTLRNTGDNNDSVVTGDGDDSVRGLAGNDTIDSRGGVDSIEGGVGDADRWIGDKSFLGAGQALVLDLNLDGVQGTYAGTGSVAGIETIDLTTGAGNDSITTRTSQQRDKITTGAGDDFIKVYGGRDTVDGGSGSDILVVDWSSFGSSDAVGSTIAGTLASGFSGQFHTDRPWFNNSVLEGPEAVNFTGIERFDLTLRNVGDNNDGVTTGDGADTVRGLAGNDVINTAGGDDLLVGGLGNDALNGGNGTDVADWSEATGNLVFVLAANGAGTFANAATGTDTYTGIEGMRSGVGDDRLVGNAQANSFFGNAGADVIIADGPLLLSAAAGQIKRLYIATLDRAPDDAGWLDWTTKREGGQSLDSIASGFVNSQEFQTKYGALDNGAFVTQLYKNVLDREPDAGGFAAYKGALDGNTLTRTAMVTGFSESAEFKAGTAPDLHASQIFRLYGATLARAPDAAGLEGWTDQMGGGRGLVDIALGFVNSSEFQTKYGALDSAGFVSLLYQNVLGRAPDQAGLDGWLAAMSGPTGQSRTQVVTGFSESAEYVIGTRAAADAFMRQTMSSWSDTLIGGAGDDKLTGGRGADRFVFTQSEGGNDTVYGFDRTDTLELNGFGFANPAAALAAMSQQGGNVVFSYAGGSVTFEATDLATLQGLAAQGWVLS